MTVTASTAATPAPADSVTCTVDGVEVTVPKGTLIIRVAEQLGVEIPRFCDHPLLDPVAACRMCLVEIEGQPKPQPACAVTVGNGMVVKTQLTSSVAEKAQQGVMEFLLINHPLDCPICDKGGECPLQNQAMTAGRATSRFDGTKRTFAKPINISAQVLLDRERCVSCARCTRFADQIAGDAFIELLERGAKQQVGIAADTPFNSYFSGNVIQICPVGALTSARYRFRSRPFDLVSVPTACEHCASGCALRTDYRRGVVLRRQAWDDPEVNEEWNCDKGRFAFDYLTLDRLTHPLVRGDDGVMHPASWPEAVRAAAAGLRAAGDRAAVLTGGRLTLEDALAYSKFARAALGTDNVDFRARPQSAEEAAFLAASVAGSGLGPTYADLDAAPVVLLVALDPEDESPILFLRLRKAARERRTRVVSLSPVESRGLQKMSATWWPVAPGGEAAALRRLAEAGTDGTDGADPDLLAALRQPGAVILVGERIAVTAGAPSAVAALAAATGARLGWVPRRAGDRGALDAGLLPGLLPGGRPLTDADARAEVATAWDVDVAVLPATPGLDADAVVAAVNAHAAAAQAAADADDDTPEPAVAALVVAGVDPDDTADPAGFLAALAEVPFLVSLETRPTAVTAAADVVLPVGVVTEKAGTFLDWEGRPRRFGAVFRDALTLTDARVLAMIADALDLGFGLQDVGALRAQAAALPPWQGVRVEVPDVAAPTVAAPPGGSALLATWRELLDGGTLQQGEEFLAATARPAVARLAAADAAALGVDDGDPVTVTGPTGAVTLPARVGGVVDRTVWLPANAAACVVTRDLGARPGDTVRISRGGAA